jgi:hypothetical protein
MLIPPHQDHSWSLLFLDLARRRAKHFDPRLHWELLYNDSKSGAEGYNDELAKDWAKMITRYLVGTKKVNPNGEPMLQLNEQEMEQFNEVASEPRARFRGFQYSHATRVPQEETKDSGPIVCALLDVTTRELAHDQPDTGVIEFFYDGETIRTASHQIRANVHELGRPIR